MRAFIGGVSSGIGNACARHFEKNGFEISGTVRSPNANNNIETGLQQQKWKLYSLDHQLSCINR